MAERRQRYLNQFRPSYSRLHEDADLRWVVPFSVRYVIAIVGPRFSGKSVALGYLNEARGFRTYSLTDQLRTEAARRGMPLEPRAILRDLGDELRAQHGDPALLARLTLRRIQHEHQAHHPAPGPPQRIAVGGFKRPEELELFQLLGEDCEVIVVTAGDELRFKRARGSGMLAQELNDIVDDRGKSPPVTLRSFRRHVDERDLRGSGSPWTAGYGQAVQALLDMPAAHNNVLSNHGTLKDFYRRIDRVVSGLDEGHRTPGA